jgi:hypothetical protein
MGSMGPMSFPSPTAHASERRVAPNKRCQHAGGSLFGAPSVSLQELPAAACFTHPTGLTSPRRTSSFFGTSTARVVADGGVCAALRTDGNPGLTGRIVSLPQAWTACCTKNSQRRPVSQWACMRTAALCPHGCGAMCSCASRCGFEQPPQSAVLRDTVTSPASRHATACLPT